LTWRVGCGAVLLAAAVAIGDAQSPRRPLVVCHAGSLSAALADVEKAFASAHPDVTVSDVSGGSVALARKLATGIQACDVYASADYLVIDRMLEPAGLADYAVVFARGRMVLAYLSTDPRARGISEANWHQKLVAAGVRVAGAHPFLDPGGYRAHMILELAEKQYGIAGLYNAVLEHYQVVPAAAGADAPALGRDFSFQFTYEHSAAATALTNPAYRYIRLPDRIDLSNGAYAAESKAAGVTLPGLGTAGAAASVMIPAAPVAWGVTVIKTSTHQQDGLAFVAMVLGPAGTSALKAHGPSPAAPIASRRDYARIPPPLRALVTPGLTAP
jgi:molybdate/tungstate transport system substrate-binding protein